MLNFLGNIIWWILGGLATATEYFLAGLILCITIIGIPLGKQCFKLGLVMLFPFGSEVGSPNAGALGCVGNVLWAFFFGIWAALTHLLFGVLLCITIIGIPWGMKHFKFMKVAFAPFGRLIDINI